MYTTYFGGLARLPSSIFPIAICLIPPKTWTGRRYWKLAPTSAILDAWQKNHDEDAYRRDFDSQILSKLDPARTVAELRKMAGRGQEIALVCYEAPGEFCHRHLVADWLRKAGVAEVKEYPYEQKTQVPGQTSLF